MAIDDDFASPLPGQDVDDDCCCPEQPGDCDWQPSAFDPACLTVTNFTVIENFGALITHYQDFTLTVNPVDAPGISVPQVEQNHTSCMSQCRSFDVPPLPANSMAVNFGGFLGPGCINFRVMCGEGGVPQLFFTGGDDRFARCSGFLFGAGIMVPADTYDLTPPANATWGVTVSNPDVGLTISFNASFVNGAC